MLGQNVWPVSNPNLLSSRAIFPSRICAQCIDRQRSACIFPIHLTQTKILREEVVLCTLRPSPFLRKRGR